MSSFNTSNSHPLIPNSNQYYIDKKFVSIHSEDRDIFRYAKSTEFEIELPSNRCRLHNGLFQQTIMFFRQPILMLVCHLNF